MQKRAYWSLEVGEREKESQDRWWMQQLTSLHHIIVLHLNLIYLADPPTIFVEEPWIHTGETSTVQLKCQICSHNPFTVSLLRVLGHYTKGYLTKNKYFRMWHFFFKISNFLKDYQDFEVWRNGVFWKFHVWQISAG